MTHHDHPNRERVDVLAERIAIAAAHIDSATSQLLADIRELDALGGWAIQGAKSCAQWLAWRIGVGLNAAREIVRTAKALGELPLIDEAMRQGRVSYSKVRAMTRVATVAIEAQLLERAVCATGAQLERICRGYRSVTAHAEASAAPKPSDRYVHCRSTADDMVLLTAKLRPDEAEFVMKAIREAQLARPRQHTEVGDLPAGDVTAVTSVDATGHPLGGATPSSMSRADALVSVAETFLAGGAARSRNGGERTLLVVQVREERLRQSEASAEQGFSWRARLVDSGAWIDTPSLLRLGCDSSVVCVRTDDVGNALDVGRRQRTVPPALRRALGLRDHGRCCFPGCDNQLVDAHHVRHWARGGDTKLTNVLSLCARHHSEAHDSCYRIEADGAGGFSFFDRFNQPIVASPPTPELGGPGAEVIARESRDAGVTIDARTSLPHWHGERLDLPAAVNGLVWRAARAEQSAKA